MTNSLIMKFCEVFIMHSAVSRLSLFCCVFVFEMLMVNFALLSDNQYFKFDNEPGTEKSLASRVSNIGLIFDQQQDEPVKNRIFIRRKKFQKLNEIIYKNLRYTDTVVKSSNQENKNVENSIGVGLTEWSNKVARKDLISKDSDIVPRHKKEVNDLKAFQTQERKNTESPDNEPSTFVSISKIEQTPPIKKVLQKPHTTSSAKQKLEDERILEQKANEHYERMTKETICKIPTSTLVKVNEIYLHSHKTYFPSCTRIHRCSKESGCCSDPEKECLPNKMENVTLQFLVMIQQPEENAIKRYESLTFLNHTECKCQYLKNDPILADAPFPSGVTALRHF